MTDHFSKPLGGVRNWVGAAVLGMAMPAAMASHIGEDLTVDQQAVASTDQLLNALRQYENAPAAQRAAQLQRLTLLAQQRRERLLALIDRNPKIAALRVLPVGVRQRFPATVQATIERDVNLSGTVRAFVADDIAGDHSHQHFQLIDAGGRTYGLGVAGASQRDLLSWVDKQASVAATQLDGQLLVRDKRQLQLLAAGSTTTTTTTTTTLASTSVVQGDQSTLVVMLNFSDKAISCTAADLQSRLFGATGATLNQGYLQSSGNLVSFSGKVVGPYTINYTSTSSCNPSGWASAANSAAIAAGHNPANYKRVSYTMPPNATCGWTGLASLGGTSPTPSWIQSCGSTGVFSHELGHNLLLHHAATPTLEYGDNTDPMGGALLVQTNAPNRVMTGWTSGSRVQDVGVGGTYSIDALENTASTVPLVLRMPKADTAETYYVSLRQGLNLDTNLPAADKGTLSVHHSTGTLPAKTVRVANLAAGQSWTDSVNGITVTHQGLTASGASVGVALGSGTCTRTPPSLSVAPASQSAAPGTALSYALTVKNNNSTACPSSAFNLTQALPAGFTGSFGAASVALMPGASTNVTWTVASPATGIDAVYTLTAAADESAVASRTETHASYTVLTPPAPTPTADTTPPTLAITNPVASTTVSGRSVGISASASDASGVSTVEFYVDGKLLGTDTSAPYSVNWNLRKTAAGGHTIRVRALDTQGNAAEKSITVSVN